MRQNVMQKAIWIALFSALFAFSMDFWMWPSDDPTPTSWGWPAWVNRFLWLQAALVIALAAFTKLAWKETPSDA
jgi:hypothetical protein